MNDRILIFGWTIPLILLYFIGYRNGTQKWNWKFIQCHQTGHSEANSRAGKLFIIIQSNAVKINQHYLKQAFVTSSHLQEKHPLLDITPTAVERLNYIQYHPMVLFLDPHSRKDLKSMRQKYMPDSNKSSRRLYAQALKLRKHYSHLFSGTPLKPVLNSLFKSYLKIPSESYNVLWKTISGFSVSFTARIDLQPNTNMWYDALKDKIRQQQSKPVWVSEVAVRTLKRIMVLNLALTSCRINIIIHFQH